VVFGTKEERKERRVEVGAGAVAKIIEAKRDFDSALRPVISTRCSGSYEASQIRF
jgi:hypothetical protein